MKNWMVKFRLLVWVVVIIGFSACSQHANITADDRDGKLKIVATTTIIGDVVSQVGGNFIDLMVLLPVGTDPHSFTPTPQDIAKVAEADLVFANGVGLEAFLDPLLESAGATDNVISLSDGLELLVFTGEKSFNETQTGDHETVGEDPHTWTDPKNVMVWVQKTEQMLSATDPENAVSYQANAEAFISALKELDNWIDQQIALIPKESRKLVSDHAIFGYYARAYGLEQIGALIPGYSTLSEPSAQDIANIEDAIQSYNVNAIFVGNTINPSLAERVAEDTATKLIYVYTGSLSELNSEADTYINYMRYNTNAFVDGMK